MRTAYLALALCSVAPIAAAAQLPTPERTLPENRVLTHRQQAPIVRARIVERFETVLPELMRREGGALAPRHPIFRQNRVREGQPGL